MILRSRIPEPLKRNGRSVSVTWGKATWRKRAKPDFLLIGGQRCGTTSLFRALMQHPDVVRPNLHKGVNYFDLNYAQGWQWYVGHFPFRATSTQVARVRRPAGVEPASRPSYFEASGYYMFHPQALPRIGRDLPEVKVLAMLRDPVERAYSAWKHEKARGFEIESFERALELEEERLAPEWDKILEDPNYESHAHRHQAYRRRGEYLSQLQRAEAALSRSQIHIIYSEDFFSQPQEEFARVCDFLEISRNPHTVFDVHNSRPGSSLPEGPRQSLRAHYERERPELEALVGKQAPWPHE